MTAALRSALDAVRIVPMGRRHLSAVLAIERQVYPKPWTAEIFAAELLRTDTRRYVVALAEEGAPGARRTRRRRRVVLGYGGVLVAAGEAHIATVAVHPAHHRRKVASRVLLSLLSAAVDLGAEAATLEVRAANRGAQRLYSQFGFAPVGLRPGYYAETREDALIMWAHDVQGAEFAARLESQRERLDEPGGASGAPDLVVPWVRGRVGLDLAPGPLRAGGA